MVTLDERYQQLKAAGTDMSEHMDLLRSCAEKVYYVTEFGVRSGVSTVAFLAARPEKLTSYDVNRTPEVVELEALAADAGIAFEFRQEDSRTASITYTDLLFIDTDHTHATTAKELLHAERVARYILLHDTQLPGAEVWQAVEEFLRDHQEWKLIEHRTNSYGLAVLGRTS